MLDVCCSTKLKKFVISLFFLTTISTVHAEFDPQDQDSGSMTPNTKVGFSFDGGGIRGLFSLVILDEIEKRLGVPVVKCFDFMSGTSTGGISVAALVCPDPNNPGKPKYSVSDVIDIYRNHGSDIFPPSRWGTLSMLYNVFGAKYSGEGIEKIADNYFGDTPLSSAVTPVGIVSNNISPDQPYIFYSDPFFSNDLQNHKDWYMKDVVRATSAAPTYLPVVNICPLEKVDGVLKPSQEEHYFIDGGVSGMNNPSAAAYASLCKLIDAEVKTDFAHCGTANIDTLKTIARTNVRFISLGTGFVESSQSYNTMKNAGILKWIQSLITLTLNMPSQSTDNYMQNFIPGQTTEAGKKIEHYWRVTSEIPPELEAMDNVSPGNIEALIQLGRDYITNNENTIAKLVKVLSYRYEIKQHLNEPTAVPLKAGVPGVSRDFLAKPTDPAVDVKNLKIRYSYVFQALSQLSEALKQTN